MVPNITTYTFNDDKNVLCWSVPGSPKAGDIMFVLKVKLHCNKNEYTK